MPGDHSGVVVQLVRIPACHAGGRGFEPRPLRQQDDMKKANGSSPFLYLHSKCRVLPVKASISRCLHQIVPGLRPGREGQQFFVEAHV